MGRCVATFIVLVFAGCGGAPGTADMVSDALQQASIRDVKVEADNGGKVVHLRGTVETLADRVRAAEIAAAIVGTSGGIRNELRVSGIDDHIGDATTSAAP